MTRSAPILSGIGLNTGQWRDPLKKFGQLFKRAEESPDSMFQEAQQRAQGWLHAP